MHTFLHWPQPSLHVSHSANSPVKERGFFWHSLEGEHVKGTKTEKACMFEYRVFSRTGTDSLKSPCSFQYGIGRVISKRQSQALLSSVYKLAFTKSKHQDKKLNIYYRTIKRPTAYK
jgi:hypothetical protein